jgi:hypothetical protein
MVIQLEFGQYMSCGGKQKQNPRHNNRVLGYSKMRKPLDRGEGEIDDTDGMGVSERRVIEVKVKWMIRRRWRV